MRTRLIGGILAALTAAALTAGCSDTSTASPPSPPAAASPSATGAPVAADHNAADVAFLQGMIPHHTQALAMSSQVPSRAASAEVKDLAARIDRAQGPEIERMNTLLDSWGQPRPQPGSMGGMAMDGMMSDQQMGQLAATSGPAFDRLFLDMMMAHHRGAITQARTELDQGQNPQAKQLAGEIIAGQQAEITEMQALLSRV